MIFNKNENGSDELKALIGFIYRSIDFEDLYTYIKLSEREMKKIIGSEIFKVAEDHYNSDDYKAEITEGEEANAALLLLDELVEYIQLPVAMNAYRMFAPGNDLSHSETGRQMYISEGLKTAFEWMIDKDDMNLLNLYHGSVDALLEFLDENKDTETEGKEGEEGVKVFEAWISSDAYIKSKELLINNADTFNDHFFINESRRLFLVLTPILKTVEGDIIRPCVSKEKYNEIKQMILEDNLSDENKPLLALMRDALALLTISKACTRLSSEVLPNGVFQHYSNYPGNTKNTSARSDRIELSKALERDGLAKLKNLQSMMTKIKPIDTETTLDMTEFTKYMDPDKKYLSL